MKNLLNTQQLQRWDYFTSSVYSIDAPKFLNEVNEVSEEYFEISKKDKNLDEIYPSYITENYFDHEKIKDFQQFIGQTAWNILDSQGYAMEDYVTYFTEMWSQEHHKHSSMEQHVHGFGSQLVGFYFLECPKNCSKLIIYDPRSAKVQINLPLKDESQISFGSNAVNFEPKVGQLIFTNSWLAHSFTKHSSDSPIKFVHFNLSVQKLPQQSVIQAAEVI
jgi:uncharacterized protein (TIGR02466 family)